MSKRHQTSNRLGSRESAMVAMESQRRITRRPQTTTATARNVHSRVYSQPWPSLRSFLRTACHQLQGLTIVEMDRLNLVTRPRRSVSEEVRVQIRIRMSPCLGSPKTVR